MKTDQVKLCAVLDLLRDDGLAMSCQSLGQYRSRLIQGVVEVSKEGKRLVELGFPAVSGCCIAEGGERDA